ncbi:MFS transporter [Nocardioides jiangxiensis]|uniref:MFS transporter n=1 Tax=Nocardioides jiangxiensis TaxID=3064524 RepID=A0ABT9AWX2_9ACTN|nr:MFS transporter [Nocardioides sp. WY-20]MDO7866815.1 MFS transporter [Nocardioides sp. WY-20]
MSTFADLRPLERAREQRAWYFYDWANSAFATTVLGALFAPYLIAVAEDAVGEHGRLHLLGLAIAPGALPSYTITVSTLLGAVLYPLVGAVADRSARKPGMLAGYAWLGSGSAALLFFLTRDTVWLGVVAFLVANLSFGASIVINDAILPLISEEHERDRASSTGWAYGYAGGGLLLAINFAMVKFHDGIGLTESMAVRLSLLSAAAWWAAFTLIPWRGIRRHAPVDVERVEGGVLHRSFGQLAHTLRDLRNYPVAVTFLVAYLFFNDGIQTVVASASTFGVEELGFATGDVLLAYLVVQFVAVGGAIGFGRLAARVGAKRTVLTGIGGWIVIVTVALVVPDRNFPAFLALAAAIGIVLGGTQALARSYFTLLIPRGKEAEYFSFYHAMDRGTSWLGTLTFGLVYQLTGSYRPAIFALIVFFVVGGALLARVDTARGMRDAGTV